MWNAASAGFTSDNAIAVLEDFARYPLPQAVRAWIKETEGRFGRLRLVPGPVIENETFLYLVSTSALVYKEIGMNPVAKKYLTESVYDVGGADDSAFHVTEDEKKFCFRIGEP